MITPKIDFKINVFKSDIFSNKKILLKKKKISKKNYDIFFFLLNKKRKIKTFYKILTFSQNSKNFLVETNKGRFLLKLENLTHNKKSSLNKIQVIKKKIGNLLSLPLNSTFLEKSNLASLYIFKKGHHFDGNINHYYKIINFLPKLLFKKNKNLFFEKSNYFSREQNKIMENLERNKGVIKVTKKYYKSENSEIVNFITSEWKRLKKIYKKKINKKKYIFHNDLHPHNILISKKNDISTLDHRSLKLVNFEISLAYCILKLCRQILSLKKNIIKEKLKQKTIKKIKSKFRYFRFSKNVKIADLARIEILRRIFFIFYMIKQNNYNYNFILPVLLNNFFEADEIFKDKQFY